MKETEDSGYNAEVFQFPKQPEPPRLTIKERLFAPKADVFDLELYRKKKAIKKMYEGPDFDPAA